MSTPTGNFSLIGSYFKPDIPLENYTETNKAIRKLDVDLLINLTSTYDFDTKTNVDEYYNTLCEIIQKSTKEQKQRSSPVWFNAELYQLHQAVKIAYKMKTEDLTPLKKMFKTRCRQLNKAHRKKVELETIIDAETNPQNIWNILKSKPLVTSCSQITLPESEKHFATLLKKE